MENFMLFVAVGVVAGAGAWIYTSLFKVTGYRQVQKQQAFLASAPL